MFDQNIGTQQLQIEALEALVDDAIAQTRSTTIHTTTSPTQATLENVVTAGAPETRVFWWDGTQIRGIFQRLRDYFAPLFSSASNVPTLSQAMKVRWFSRDRFWVHGSWFTTTTGSFTTTSQLIDFGLAVTQAYSLSSIEIVDHYIPSNYLLYVTSANNLTRKLGAGAGLTVANIGPSSTVRAAAVTANGTVFFRDSTNPNNVQRRTTAGVISTIVTGFTDLYHMRWDETTQKLILFSHTPPSPSSSASSVNPDGTGLTTLVPSGSYAAGYAGTFGAVYEYTGVDVHNGFLYVPEPGSRYVNTYRKYDILAGTYVTESFDFGDARAILAPAVAEAKDYMNAAAGFLGMKQAQYWGSQFYAYLFERLINFRHYPTENAWLLTYETGKLSPLPGAQSNLAWAIYSEDGISRKFYPVLDYSYRQPDYYVVAERTYDTAVKELILEWDASLLADYSTIELIFDNGLITATETIRVQFGGDTTSTYEYSFWRNAVSTTSNSTPGAGVTAAYIDLYGINTTTVLGGVYKLTVEGYSNTTAAQTFGIQIEGFTAAGVTTGTINSILGTAKWAKPSSVTFNSVRVFLSGATASFPTGATIRLAAYRTSSAALLGGGLA